MSAKRQTIAVATAVALAPLLVSVLGPGTASAHGYISSPASRQAQCAKGTVPCGPIKYEPQSVEGPKGLRDCAGGNASFRELNDDNKGWTVHNVGRTVNFVWTFTARHRTANYEYYIGNTRVGFVDGQNRPPGQSETHSITLGNFTGKQKLLAIWNIGDTANAFYACVDLNIGGSGGPTTTTTQPPTTTTTPPTTTSPTTTTTPPGQGWAAGTRYEVGTEVAYQNGRYVCVQAHTAQPGWEPAAAPALWQKI